MAEIKIPLSCQDKVAAFRQLLIYTSYEMAQDEKKTPQDLQNRDLCDIFSTGQIALKGAYYNLSTPST